MKLNCKQGDLAIIVTSYAGNEGKIVRVLRFLPNVLWHGIGFAPSWETDQLLPSEKGGLRPEIADYQLRPINNPGDEEIDEMLRITPSPVWELAHKVTT